MSELTGRSCGRATSRLHKLHADHGSLPPHHTARAARMIDIKDDLKSLWDRAANLYLGSCFRKIANDALNGTTIRPSNGGAGGPKNLTSF